MKRILSHILIAACIALLCRSVNELDAAESKAEGVRTDGVVTGLSIQSRVMWTDPKTGIKITWAYIATKYSLFSLLGEPCWTAEPLLGPIEAIAFGNDWYSVNDDPELANSIKILTAQVSFPFRSWDAAGTHINVWSKNTLCAQGGVFNRVGKWGFDCPASRPWDKLLGDKPDYVPADVAKTIWKREVNLNLDSKSVPFGIPWDDQMEDPLWVDAQRHFITPLPQLFWRIEIVDVGLLFERGQDPAFTHLFSNNDDTFNRGRRSRQNPFKIEPVKPLEVSAIPDDMIRRLKEALVLARKIHNERPGDDAAKQRVAKLESMLKEAEIGFRAALPVEPNPALSHRAEPILPNATLVKEIRSFQDLYHTVGVDAESMSAAVNDLKAESRRAGPHVFSERIEALPVFIPDKNKANSPNQSPPVRKEIATRDNAGNTESAASEKERPNLVERSNTRRKATDIPKPKSFGESLSEEMARSLDDLRRVNESNYRYMYGTGVSLQSELFEPEPIVQPLPEPERKPRPPLTRPPSGYRGPMR